MMNEKRTSERRWWLALLPVLLGFLLILFCWWLGQTQEWGGNGSGSGSGTGTRQGPGSGTGTGTGRGNGPEKGRSTISGSGTVRAHPHRNTAGTPSASPSPAPSSGRGAATPKKKQPAAGTSPRQPVSPATVGPEKKRDQMLGSDMPLLAPSADFQPGASAADTPRGGGGGAGRFYGLRLRKDENVLFLVDVSGSMGAGTAENRSRLEVLKKELLRAIRRDPKAEKKRGKFFIVPYADDAVIIPRTLRPFRFHRSEDLAAAENEINALNCGGGTRMGTAWQKILPYLKHYEIHCVYFLTDGEPTDGFSADQFAALKERSGTTFRVECIAVGRDSELLKAIATQSRGRCLVVH